MEDFYQEEEKELEYIPNETTIAQLFVLQEVVMYYVYIYSCTIITCVLLRVGQNV